MMMMKKENHLCVVCLGIMTGIEEVASASCFHRLLKCCLPKNEEVDGDIHTDVKVELNFVCCGGKNKKKKSKVKLERYKSRSFQSLFSFNRKRDDGNKGYGYDYRVSNRFKETEV